MSHPVNLDAYERGLLGEGVAASLERHLQGCVACRSRLTPAPGVDLDEVWRRISGDLASGVSSSPGGRPTSWRVGLVTAGLAFLAVMAVGLSTVLLAPFPGTPPPPLAEGPMEWPSFMMTFSGSTTLEEGRLIWAGPDAWRLERTVPRNDPDLEELARLMEEKGDQEGADFLRSRLESPQLQVVIRDDDQAIRFGSTADPQEDGLPLALFDDPVAPAEAWQHFDGFDGPLTATSPTHALATSAGLVENAEEVLRIEFNPQGIPVLAQSTNSEDPWLRVTSLVARPVDRVEVISPNPIVRQYVERLSTATTGVASEVMADGVVTFDEYRRVVDATIVCLRDEAPGIIITEPTYDPVSGNFVWDFGGTSGPEELDDPTRVYDACHRRYDEQVVVGWLVQLEPITEQRLEELGSYQPSADERAMRAAEPTEAVSVPIGESMRLEAWQQGPGICVDFATFDEHDRPATGLGVCWLPEVWDQALHVQDSWGGPRSDEYDQGQLLGTVAKTVERVVIEFPDGHAEELEPVQQAGFSVAFIATSYSDGLPHGLPERAVAYGGDGEIIADQLLAVIPRLVTEYGFGRSEILEACSELDRDDVSERAVLLRQACEMWSR